MSAARRIVAIHDGVLFVNLSDGDSDGGTSRVSFDAVVDEAGLGEVVGIEILDMRAQLGVGAPPPSPTKGIPRWSYDDEVDAFYLRLAEGTASIQRVVRGTALVSTAGHVLSLEVPVEP